MTNNRLTIQLDPEHMEPLDALAVRQDRSVSYLVRQAVADFLARQGYSVSVSRSKNTRRALRKHAREAAK